MDDERGAPDALESFFDDVRTAAAATPAPVLGASLAALFEHGTMPAALAPLPRARRRQWSLRIAVASAVGGLTLGGLGVAGALPAPVQRRVADVVDVVGVHLPDGRPATTTTVVPTTTTLTRPATTGDRRVTSTTVEDRGQGVGDDHRGRDGDSSGSGGEGSGSGSDEHRSTTTTFGDDHRDGGSGHSGSGGDSSGSGSGGTADRSFASHGDDLRVLSDRTDSSGSGSGHD